MRAFALLRRAVASSASSASSVSDVNPVILHRPGSSHRVHLIGTAHISAASADAVRVLIRTVKPRAVYLELDPQRARKMRARWRAERDGHGGSASEGDSEHDMAATIARAATDFARDPAAAVSKLPAAVLGKSLARFYKGFARLGFVPGGEFKVAMEEADALGAHIHMMDRDSNDTLRNLSVAIVHDAPGWLGSMLRGGNDLRNYPGLTKLANVSSLKEIAELLSEATRPEVRRLVEFVRNTSPKVMDAMLDQRDVLMAGVLRQAVQDAAQDSVVNCQRQPGTHSDIVAVVGKAHMDGIERLFYLTDGEFARRESDVAA